MSTEKFEDYEGYKAALEGDLFCVVGAAALAVGVTVTEGQALAIAHAVMRYMLATEDAVTDGATDDQKATP